MTRNISGPAEGAEIWTYFLELGDNEIEIFVDYFVPGVPEEAREKVGRAYARAYELLYDEDVEMMTQRQKALDQRIEGVSVATQNLELGSADELTFPMEVSFAGRELVVNEVGGDFLVYPARCPHMMAPLTDVAVEDGVVQCPWPVRHSPVRTSKR